MSFLPRIWHNSVFTLCSCQYAEPHIGVEYTWRGWWWHHKWQKQDPYHVDNPAMLVQHASTDVCHTCVTSVSFERYPVINSVQVTITPVAIIYYTASLNVTFMHHRCITFWPNSVNITNAWMNNVLDIIGWVAYPLSYVNSSLKLNRADLWVY